ncbi:sugar transporter [Hymenopellis radicata]|nr:sugar transporter [Hymenopellis radicata]
MRDANAEVDPNAQFGGLEARQKLEKKLLRKLDARMSVLLLIYILNYIDRNNASAARLKGFEEDLHLKGEQFATLLSILYVGYILMQVPSNMFLNKIGKPSVYIPCCILIWGMISCLTGVTTNFVGALLTRFFLGFVEAAFLPGSLFLISKWYKRDEIGLRNAILFCGNIISNAFGTLMASGILSRMDGKLGHAAWRWLFFIEGAITMTVAVIAYFVLPDFPSTTPWLFPQERALAELRMTEDVGVSDDSASKEENTSAWLGLQQAFTDWRVWWMSLALTAEVIALSFNIYFPTLTSTLGYGSTESLLLCAPPWVFAAIVAFALSRHSDKVKERFWHITASYSLGLVGFIIAIATMNTAARYVSLFLMAQSYSGFIVFYAWLSNSFPRPAAKRAVVLALTNALSQLGNIAGSYIWPKDKFGPTYRNSYAICIATSSLSIIMCFMFRLELQRQNKKLEEAEEAELGEGEAAEPGFRYML